MSEEKRFDEWILVKASLHDKEKLRVVKEGEIWWCGVGENVGVEINGKGEMFARPVLIFRKLSRFGFLGVPLTSQAHDGSWYAKFRFKGKDEYAVLAQIRNLSIQRLYRKMGSADDADLALIRLKMKELLKL